MMKKGIQPTRLDQERVPYLVDDKLWVGYEDIDSIKEKVNHGRYTEDRLKNLHFNRRNVALISSWC